MADIETITPRLPKDWSDYTENQKEEFIFRLMSIINSQLENEVLMQKEINTLYDKTKVSIWYKFFYMPFIMLVTPIIIYLSQYPVTFPITMILWSLYLIFV